MQTALLLTNAIAFVDNVSDPTSGAQAKRRARYLTYAQQGLGELWLDPHEFSWTRRDGVVAIAAGERSGSLPADWRTMGRNGTVWGPADSDEPMESVAPYFMQREQEGGTPTSRPDAYSIFGQHPTTRASLIQVPVAVGAYQLTLRAYLSQVPTLTDADTNSGLDQLPEDIAVQYMESYLRFRGYDDRGDKRASRWEARYKDAREAARQADQHQKDTPQFVAGFVGEDDSGMW